MSQFSESVQRHMIGGNNNKPHPSFGAHSWKMAEEAALAPDDAGKILEKLLDAQNKSFMLGLGLNLRLRDIEAIHARYTDPRERLLHIIIAFLREEEPRPTWSVILEALRNPIVSLTAVARRVETALFATAAQPTTSAPVLYPSTLSSQQGIGVSNQDIKHTPALLMAVSPDSPVESPRSSLHTQQGTSHNTTHSALGSSLTTFHQELTSSAPTPVPIPTQAHPHQLASTGDSGSVSTITTSSDEVKQMISELDSKFDTLKNSIRECLEKRGVQVKRVADILTSLSADEDEHHKMFLESHVSVLFKAANVAELFGTMNFHWNYLSPPPLDHLVHKFNLVEVKSQLEAYNSDLLQFRMKTLLTLFCQTQRKKRIRLSPDFHEVVAEFEWTENVTLEDVEQFRQEYASHYNLRECAMMIAEVRPGSFIVTWYVPKSVVEKLKTKVPRPILKQHGVQKLQIAGVCVYRIVSPSSPPALTSQQSMITLTTDDEEEEEKEPDDIGTSTLETSVRSNNKRSLRPRTYNSSVSSDRGYSSAHSLHRACRTLHSTRTLGVFCPRTLTDTSSNSSSTYPYKSSFKSQRTSFTTVTKFYRVTPKKYLKNSRATSALTVVSCNTLHTPKHTNSYTHKQLILYTVY
ncbi:hypothetical protein GBAR_LOCUS10228 [Geodia barretti]|uniref:Uncharacterized protein n=1 Tax=Geodia barretti TaxID=519541 RepID=A0AA35RS28_GEOBA|nr:hypothetical protein GBAR_LOCUS10228 [Geodia barretti]